ncbi:DNA-directed RNA polymerase subunit P [archaeon]|nr:DNA-directed RNA polymerase subunit P [archaeon]
MVSYGCFECDREVKYDLVRKKVRCPYCGSKILEKKSSINSVVKAI